MASVPAMLGAPSLKITVPEAAPRPSASTVTDGALSAAASVYVTVTSPLVPAGRAARPTEKTAAPVPSDTSVCTSGSWPATRFERIHRAGSVPPEGIIPFNASRLMASWASAQVPSMSSKPASPTEPRSTPATSAARAMNTAI